MIAAESAVPIVVSTLALIGSVTVGYLTYKASTKQARNAERNTDLDQVRLANESMSREIDRLTKSEENCQKRLSIAERKLAHVEMTFREDRELMSEMRTQQVADRIKMAELERRLGGTA